MKDGTGLNEFFEKYKERSFDVGISEEHAVTLAGGLATGGFIPVVSIYSTFLQRAFDQIIHDVAMQKAHVIFAIDRAGLVGNDGETHQGIFDLSYLSLIPNMIVLAPKCPNDLRKMLKWSINRKEVIAIRFPKGEDKYNLDTKNKISFGKWEYISNGGKTCIITEGRIVGLINEIRKNNNLDITLINAQFIKPIDKKILSENKDKNIIIIEDNVLNGGLSSQVKSYLIDIGFNKKIKSLGFDDKFIEQGSIEELYNQEGINEKNIINIIREMEK